MTQQTRVIRAMPGFRQNIIRGTCANRAQTTCPLRCDTGGVIAQRRASCCGAVRLTQLDLSKAALGALRAAGIHDVARLIEHQTGELIQRRELSSGAELYEIVCALHRHGRSFSLYRGSPQTEREREMFRLRVIEGLTLKEVGERLRVHPERVRQLLWLHFRLKGTPPAVRARRMNATGKH